MASYIVQSGDFPFKIAREFGISFEDFSEMNPGLCDGTQCRLLHPGDRLNVPDAPDSEAGSPPPFQPQAPFEPQEEAAAPVNASPLWMAIANREIGTHESAVGDNPRILQYLGSVGLGGPDETSWCAAFVNWCLQCAGAPRANTGRAASWATFGRAVRPTYGAITVLQPLVAGASGHVGFLHAIVDNQIWLLSGNSDNQVRLSPYHTDKLIGHEPFRWPF